jgi:hypothetical protein
MVQCLPLCMYCNSMYHGNQENLMVSTEIIFMLIIAFANGLATRT